jgi:hypothetical protein
MLVTAETARPGAGSRGAAARLGEALRAEGKALRAVGSRCAAGTRFAGRTECASADFGPGRLRVGYVLTCVRVVFSRPSTKQTRR